MGGTAAGGPAQGGLALHVPGTPPDRRAGLDGAGPAAGRTTSERVLRRRAERASRVRPFPAPAPDDVHLLGVEAPVVRLDRRRSAVGALRVSGATSAAWESTDGVVGAATVDGAEAGRIVPTPGNRPLVGFHDGDVLIALRHVRSLRRALVMARGEDRLVVSTLDGTSLAVESGDDRTMTILAVSVIDGELELRAEPFPRGTHDGDVFAAFGFVLSAPSTRN